MSTQDVFQYFAQFAPTAIEWIDDSSCMFCCLFVCFCLSVCLCVLYICLCVYHSLCGYLLVSVSMSLSLCLSFSVWAMHVIKHNFSMTVSVVKRSQLLKFTSNFNCCCQEFLLTGTFVSSVSISVSVNFIS